MELNTIAMLDRVLEKMRVAVSMANWDAVRRLNDTALTIFLDAVFAQDREAMESARKLFNAFASEVRSRVAEANELDIVSALMANVTFAKLAARRRPTKVAVKVDPALTDARQKALWFLRRDNNASTAALAVKVGVRSETMSRILTGLKAEGLVTSQRSGRSMLSSLTPRGIAATGGQKRVAVEIRSIIPPELLHAMLEEVRMPAPRIRSNRSLITDENTNHRMDRFERQGIEVMSNRAKKETTIANETLVVSNRATKLSDALVNRVAA